MKKLIVGLVLVFSLTAMSVFADTEHPEKNNYWTECVDVFHVVYEAVFAPYDREWIQYIYNKYGEPESDENLIDSGDKNKDKDTAKKHPKIKRRY